MKDRREIGRPLAAVSSKSRRTKPAKDRAPAGSTDPSSMETRGQSAFSTASALDTSKLPGLSMLSIVTTPLSMIMA
jgi:hypothetical protein